MPKAIVLSSMPSPIPSELENGNSVIEKLLWETRVERGYPSSYVWP